MPVYKLDNEIYNIPDDVVSDFEKDNPSASVSYMDGDDEYEIPLDKRDGFVKAFPKAKLKSDGLPPKYLQRPEGADAVNLSKPPVEQSPSLSETVNTGKFAPVDFSQRTEANAMSPYSSESLGTRLHQMRKDGKLDTIINQNEEKEIDKTYAPQKVTNESDIVENYRGRFAQTERGRELGNELDVIRKEITDKYAKEYKSSERYKQLSAQFSGQQLNEEINKDFQLQYEERISKEIAPYSDAYSQQVFNRYGVGIQKELTALAKDRTKSQLSDLRSSIEQELEKEHPSVQAPTGASFIPGTAYGAAQRYGNTNTKENQDRYTSLVAAKNLLDEADDIVNESSKKGSTNFVGGLVRGLQDKGFDVDTWSMGITDTAYGSLLKKATQKSDKGEALSPEEEKLLEAAAVNMATQAYFSSDLGRGYKAGGTTAQSIPFMLEFALNPVSASGSAIAKGILKFGAKRFGLKALGNAAARNSLKVGSRLAGDAVAAVGMTATTGLGHVASGAQERMIGDVQFDFNKDGKIEYSGRNNQMSEGDAWLRSTISNTLENQSEMVFNAFKGAGNIIGLPNAGRIFPGIERFSSSKAGELYRAIKNNPAYRQLAEKTQFHGMPEEYFEEVYNNLANIPLGESTWNEATDIDSNIDTFLGVAPTSILMSMVGLGSVVRESYSTRKDMRRFEKTLSDDELSFFNDLKQKIKDGNIEDAREFVKLTLSDEALTPEQKKEEIRYVYGMLQENAIESVQKAETDEAIEKETEEIVNSSNLSTETLTECNRITTNDIGEPELIPGHIVEWMGGTVVEDSDGTKRREGGQPIWQAVGSNERITLKEGEYDPDSIQSMSTKDMIDATAEMMREEAKEKAEREANYSPEIIPPASGLTFSDTEGRSYTIVQPNPDGGWITEVISMDEKGNQSVQMVDISDKEYYDAMQIQIDAREKSANMQPEVNEMSGNPLGNEGVASVDENMMGSNEVDTASEVVAPVDESIQEQKPVFPVDEKGNTLYHKMPVEGTIVDLTDGTLDDNEIDGFIEANKAEAGKLLKKVSESAPKISTNKVKYLADKRVWQEKVADAQAQVDYWNSVNEEIAASRVQPGDKTAEAILSMGEPMNGDELAAMMLGTGRLPILYGSYKKETGGRNAEARGMVGLFASKANGGMSIEEAGEQLMLADQESGTNFFEANDPNAGRNAIIDVLSGARTRGDLFGFIQRNREAMAERERHAELEAYEQTIAKLAEASRMTPEEFIAFEENIAQMLEERLKDVSDEELKGIFAELYLEENERGRESNEVGTGVPEGEERVGSNEGSSGILSEERSDDAGASERSAEQPDGNVEIGEPGNSVLPETATVAGRTEVELPIFFSPTKMEEESLLDYAARIDESKRVHDAGKEVDANPTEAQKEAGNYKKGHIKIDGFDITIENPKGTVRSGVDAAGTPWSITMNNTYGYIRGTEGVDGDHIDVFFGDGGSNVYVVDQVNQDGSFDEHKVMYGFNLEEEARDAYLANYSPGWNGLGSITGVSKELFKEWIGSSHRKTKPFNEYKSVQDVMQSKVSEDKGVFTVEDVDAIRKNPLTVEEIEGSAVEPELKTLAKDYLAGNESFINLVAYQNIYNDVRNRTRGIEPNSTDSSETHLDEVINGNQGGLESRFSRGEVDNVGARGSETPVSRSGRGGKTSTKQFTLFDGERGDHEVRGEEPAVDGISPGREYSDGSGSTGGNGRDVSGPARSKTGSRGTKNDTGRRTSAGHEETNSVDVDLQSALDDFKDILNQFGKTGKNDMSLSLVGLNKEQIQLLPRLVSSGVKLGYQLIKKEVYDFKKWAEQMRSLIGDPLKQSIGYGDTDVNAFIQEMWNSKFEMDGEIHTLAEWSAKLGTKELKKQVSATLEEKRAQQMAAESIPVKIANAQNIDETLPYLLPQQREDVRLAEVQFFDESHQDREHGNGKGYLFTNGTGTGKTYTGLGIVKRFIKQGKNRILVVTPSQPKVTDWMRDAANLGIELRDLDTLSKERGTTATTEKGEGAVITTFANLRQNKALLEDTFDLIVYDESHRIMENKQGEATIGADVHFMITNRNANDALRRYSVINPKYQAWQKAQEVYKKEMESSRLLMQHAGDNEIGAKGQEYEKRLEDAKAAMQSAEKEWKEEEGRLKPLVGDAVKRTKTVFLSATPFNTRESLSYTEGYIFSYPKENTNTVGSYHHHSPQTEFYLTHFGAGYKFRYGRLERGLTNADALVKQEIAFSDYLENELGTKSGRIIDSEYDYSRDFPMVTLKRAQDINDAIEGVWREDALNPLSDALRQVWFNYNYTSALLETMKISATIPRMREYLKMGRKVVVFHRRVQSKEALKPPFRTMLSIAREQVRSESDAETKKKLRDAIALFEKKHEGLLQYEQTLDYSMPREQIAEAFGEENVLFFSGKESGKTKNKAVELFNDDDSGKNIIVIQEASGKEGISLHDTSGKHQRVLITLALPQSPITALQIEGRIYRIGNKSNAIFEYPLLGLDSEIILFGQQFNQQVSTTENLALGSKARDLRSSFTKGVEEHTNVPLEQQGLGGKEFDKGKQEMTDPYEDAVLDYYGNQKVKGRRYNREGMDYFATPEPVGFKMVEWAMPQEGESALEPSAGHGAIARYVSRDVSLTAIEPSNSLFGKLQLKAGGMGRKFVNDLFENYAFQNKHDVIVMNPPFGTAGKKAMDHLEKAFDHLTEGGRVVALIPRGQMDKRFEKWYGEKKEAVVTAEINLPPCTFEQAGTSVYARVVVIDRIGREETRRKAPYRRDIDLSGIKTVKELFERLKDIEVPGRTIDEVARNMKNAKKTVKEFKEIKGVDAVVDTDGVYAYGRSGMTLFSQRFDSESMANIPNEYARMHHWIEANGTADMGNRAKERIEVYVTGMKTLRNLTGKTHEQLMEGRESGKNILPVDSATVIGITSEQQRSGDKYSYKEDRNTKTGEVMHLAIPLSKDLDRELYLQMVACAKRNDGYWNRFKKAFHFQTKEGADEFIKESATIGEDGNVRFRLLDIEGVNGNPAVERAEIVSEVEALSDSLHAPVRIVKSVDELTESDSARKRIEKGNRVKGWFDTKSQEVVVYLPHAVSVEDANETVLHEVVGHYGLRKMFGEDFDTFLDNVYANASTEVRKGIVDRANRKGNILDLREATEEYLAELAERGFENAEERSLWQKIKDAFVELLRKVGVELGFELTDNELRYILWKSYQNLESPSIMDRAADVYMQNRLGVGEFGIREEDTEREKSRKGYEQSLNVVNEFTERHAGTGSVFVIRSKEMLRKQLEVINVVPEDIDKYELWMQEGNIPAFFAPKYGRIIVLDSNLPKEELNAYLWHESTHKSLRDLFGDKLDEEILKAYEALRADENFIGLEDYIRDLYAGDAEETIREECIVYLFEALYEQYGEDALGRNLSVHKDGVKNKFFQKLYNQIVYGTEATVPRGNIGRNVQPGNEELPSEMEMRYSDGDSKQQEAGGRSRDELRGLHRDEAEGVSGKRFRTGESTEEEREPDGTIEAYETALKKQGFRAQEAYQDSMLALKVFQDVVLAKDGSKLKSFEDSYKAENRISSVSTREKEVFSKVFLNPIITEVARLIKGEDATYRDITGYLIAKHGLERNIVLRERKAVEAADKAVKERIDSATREHSKGHISEEEYNSAINETNLKRNEIYQKELEKNANKDYSGLTGLMENFSDEKNGDFTAFAEQFVSDFESKHNTKELWTLINKATSQTLKKSYESGLMSLEQYESLKGRFKNYVPLRGWDETMADEVYEYLDNMRSPVNSLLKSADGRKSLADDPIATIGNMADSTILQGNRNIMKQNFLNFVINHPSDLAQVKDMWYVKDNVSGDFVPSFPNIPENATAEDVANIVSEHEENMKFLEKDGLAMRGKNGLELFYKILPYQKSEHIVSMKRNGKNVVVYINGNPRVAQALNGLTNPDVESNAILSGLGKLNRILAANFTTRNPAFVLSNLSRDLIFSTSAVAVKDPPLYLARFSTNIPKSIATVIKGIRGNGGTSEADKYFQEFLDNGGETGYANLTNVDKYKNMIQKEIKHLTKKDYFKLVRQGLELFEDFNRMAEDVARFNTYMTSRQEGRSIVEAINDAKEITVNFNKKGAGYKSINKLAPWYAPGNVAAYSAGIFKNLYLFFNAGIQSLFNFNSLYKKNWKKFGGLLGGFTAAGFLTPLVNSLLQSFGGDGDDEDYYANLSEWTRRNNLCLYIPGSKGYFVTIPLPIELRAFYGLGEMAYQQTVGNGGKKGTEIAYDAVNQLTELLPLNPLGNNGDVVATIFPDAAKPIWQIMKNEDFTGRPIYKKNTFNETMPEWTKTYKGTSKWLTELSEWSNELGGGDKYKTAPGLLNWNPAVVEHVLQGYFGGMATTLNQLGKTMVAGVESVVDGEKSDDLTWRNAPVLSRFINNASDERSSFRAINEKYYQLYDLYKEVDKNLHGYSKEVTSGNLDYLDKLNGLYQSKDYAIYEAFKSSKNKIDRLRQLEAEIPDAMGDTKDNLQTEIKKLKKEIVGKVK